jgi:hypothetical protein
MVLITNPQSVIPESQSVIANLNRQSPISIANLNRQSPISIGNRQSQSAIVNRKIRNHQSQIRNR